MGIGGGADQHGLDLGIVQDVVIIGAGVLHAHAPQPCGGIVVHKGVSNGLDDLNGELAVLLDLGGIGHLGEVQLLGDLGTRLRGVAFGTKALAKEVAQFGITVNAVSPGSVSPADNRDIDFSEPSGLSFMGRTGTDMENANLICFLASDEASYISGQNIQIDGCRKKF